MEKPEVAHPDFYQTKMEIKATGRKWGH